MYRQRIERIKEISDAVLSCSALPKVIVDYLAVDVVDAELLIHYDMQSLRDAIDTLLIEIPHSGMTYFEVRSIEEALALHEEFTRVYLAGSPFFTNLQSYSSYYLHTTWIRMKICRLEAINPVNNWVYHTETTMLKVYKNKLKVVEECKAPEFI